MIKVISILLFLLQITDGSRPDPTHFVLVHGSCHGAWSWYKLVALLKLSGHNVTALDLAASGIDLRQVDKVTVVSDYFRPLIEFMDALPLTERVILVGHSLGGLAISHAMERFSAKIWVAIFVTATMPGPTLNISTIFQESLGKQDSQLDSVYTYGNGPNYPPTTFIFGPLYLATNLYQLSPIEDWALATTLMRPVYLYTQEDLSNEIVLSVSNYGSVRRVFVIAGDDKVATEDFQRWMIGKNPPEEVVEIAGADHMVMMSKPVELFIKLQRIADEYT